MTNFLRKAHRLLRTGWQSWSIDYGNRAALRFPVFDYSPSVVDDLVIEDFKMKNIQLKRPVKGWCSWYAFGMGIDEEKILAQAKWLKDNKLEEFNYILIDGGWESHWGDWMQVNKDKFPYGLESIAAKIKDMGLKPAIWIAPFLVSPNSEVCRKHPDWLVRKNGKFVEGIKFSPLDKYFPYKRYIIDVRNKEAVDYVEKSIKWLVRECGFELLKLDFLYGIYFNPDVANDELDEFLRGFLLKIKKEYPEIYTIGCGCPLLPAIGAVDSMRIGFDTLIPFVQNIPGIRKVTNHYLYNRVIKSIKHRSWTKIFWNVDPDVFVCRKSLGLSDKQIYTLQKDMIELDGNIFLGDDLTKLDEKRVENFIRPLL